MSEQFQSTKPERQAMQFEHGAQLDLRKSNLMPLEQARELLAQADAVALQSLEKVQPQQHEQVGVIGRYVLLLREEKLQEGETGQNGPEVAGK
jgi:hypothetical protein